MKNMRLILIFVSLVTSTILFGQAQKLILNEKPLLNVKPQDVIFWNKVSESFGANSQVGLRLNTLRDFTIYKNKLKFDVGLSHVITKINYPKAIKQLDPLTLKQVDVYSGGNFIIDIKPTGSNFKKDIILRVTSLGCTKTICLFPFTKEFIIKAK